MNSITVKGLTGAFQKILHHGDDYLMVYRWQDADLRFKTFCGIWNRLEDFGAIELQDAPVNVRGDCELINNNLFVAASAPDGNKIIINHYKDFEPHKSYEFGTHRNQNVKICATASGNLACVSYRQQAGPQGVGVALDMAHLDLTTEALWTGSVVLSEDELEMPAIEHILLGPDGLVWVFFIKDGFGAVRLCRFKETIGLEMVDYTNAFGGSDYQMAPNAELPAFHVVRDGDRLLASCPGTDGVGCGVVYAKPFVAELRSDLTKTLLKHFDMGVARHSPPLPIFCTGNLVSVLICATDSACAKPPGFEVYDTTNGHKLAQGPGTPLAWHMNGFLLYRNGENTPVLEQLPIGATLHIERSGTQCTISWAPDYPYALQETNNLNAPRWTTISTTNPTIVSAVGDQRFYRLASNNPVPQLLRPPIPEPIQKRAETD